MTDDTYERLCDKTRSNNYRLPCHCEVCEKYGKVISVEEEVWNDFRRAHFLLVKSGEIKEIRNAPEPLKIALKDKFGRSEQTAWLPYLD